MRESNCLLSYKNTAIEGGGSGVTNIQLLSSRCSRDKRSCVNLQQSKAALLFQPPRGTVKKSSQLAVLTYFPACCFCSLLALSLLLLTNLSPQPPPADSPEYADTTQNPDPMMASSVWGSSDIYSLHHLCPAWLHWGWGSGKDWHITGLQ